MLSTIRRLVRTYTESKALVLLYHRVAEPESDIWDLAVTPARFEQQLRFLQKTGLVISAEELVAQLAKRTLKRRSVVITFDDGYVDNFLAARPLLAHYQLPATFFVASGNVGSAQEFWWDELEHLCLFAERLPPICSLAVAGCHLAVELGAEQLLSPALRQRHLSWKVCHEVPPTKRAALFYQLWQLLKPLPYSEQQQQLRLLRAWAGASMVIRPAYHSLSPAQLRELSSNQLFTIGAHTVTHPALASHSASLQAQELRAGQQALSQITGRLPALAAYPYGNYDEKTMAVAAGLALTAAFTTEARAVTNESQQYQLGRFQVGNWAGDEFYQRLDNWFAAG